MALDQLRVTTLRQAMEAVLAADGARRTATVASVHVGHSSALVELLAFQEVRNGWKLPNIRRLKGLASIDAILIIVSAGILPTFAAQPTDESVIHELERYALIIQEDAALVGGTFAEEVKRIADRLLRQVADARRHPIVDATRLTGNARAIIRLITTFRSRDFTLSEESDD